MYTKDELNKIYSYRGTWVAVLVNLRLPSVQKDLYIVTDAGSGAAVVPGRLFTMMLNAKYLLFSAMHITMLGHL